MKQYIRPSMQEHAVQCQPFMEGILSGSVSFGGAQDNSGQTNPTADVRSHRGSWGSLWNAGEE